MPQRLLIVFVLVCLIVAAVPGATQAGAGAVQATDQAVDHSLDTGAVPAGIPADWWGQAQEGIRQSEYDITWQETTYLADLPAAYQAPNRAQGIRTYFTPQGIRVIPRAEDGPSWELRLALAGYGPAELTATGNQVTYARAHEFLREWYVNYEQGLETEWELYLPRLSPLAPLPLSRTTFGGVGEERGGGGWGEVSLSLSTTLTPHLTPDGTVVAFADPTGTVVLRYGPFSASDAAGGSVPVHLALSSSSLLVSFCPLVPASPITLRSTLTGPGPTPEGLSPTPNWTAEGDQAGAGFGLSAGTAGDVNGDGYTDIIVGAPGYDNGQVDEGRAFVYHGSASGLALSPNWTAESNQANANFGSSVGTAGDVNGDGYADVIVGAYLYDNSETDEGQAFVYHGSPTGLSPTANWTAESDQSNACFGYSVGTAGDVNGDGYGDVIVGAPRYNNGQVDEGAAFVYKGSAEGLNTIMAWMGEGNQAAAQYGYSVATAGDVNGDGYADVIAGALTYDNGQTDEGAAWVYLGGAAGLATSPDWTAEGDQGNAQLGGAAGTAGDVNGDGYSDVIVGVRLYDNDHVDEGAAWVYHGSAAGLSTTPNWTGEGDQPGAAYGHAVGTAGDVNGDGYADVAVGAPLYDNGPVDKGRALAYFGGPAGLSIAPNWAAESDQDSAWFGGVVASAGDVNGDGYGDVIIGAGGYDNDQTDEGRAYVYHGSPAGLAAAAGWTAESDQAGASFGFAVSTAGDVNGDGYADIIVGAPLYDNGQVDEGRAYVYHGSATGLSTSADWTAEGNQANAQFGAAVGTAGDVNGDGYADVIVGAIYYDNGETDEGTAFVYLGSNLGLSLTPAWMAESDQAGACLGISVAAAGDVNGDGYADVIVGAINYDHPEGNEGRAYAYYGSAAGLSASPNWTAESDQAGALFGAAVGTAGDVNGDGYADVIVGAFQYDNGELDEGRAFVYYGSPAGLSPTANWTAEGNQIGALFGIAVGTAGDVNGDGYADVIVGAAYYDNGQADEGRAYIYHGSATGLSTTPNWTSESDQDGARLGYSVGTAGDVNGDGYADVIVGAYWYSNGQNCEGKALVFHGSSTGLSLIPDWATEGDQANAWFGRPVGTAGDVNGDGYADVIVGAFNYDNGEQDEGRAFVYYGNEGPGLDLNPRQRRSDNSAPIAPLGISDQPDGFRLALLGRTPFGRGRVKLEWEVKPLGVLFDGTGTQQSPAWLDTGIAGVQFNELVSGLLTGTAYHWRVRLLYHPGRTPFQHHSRWLTVPRNGWNEQDLRTRTVDEPIAGLSAANDSPTALGQPTSLTATVTAGSSVVYTWTFGDGGTGNGAALVHTYAAAGAYTALVTASNAVSELTATTTVIVEETIAGLTAVNDSPTPLGSVTHLTATVTAGSNVLYSWALGDGTTGIGPVQAHTYLAAGSYPALVTATNAVSTITATTTVQVVSSGQRYVYLPIVFKGYFLNPCEPNDNPAQACGPLAAGQTQTSYPDDQEDWFYVELASSGNLTAEVTYYTAQGNLLVYAEGDYVNPIAQWGQGGSTMIAGPVAVAAGRYYVRVYTASGFNTDVLYNLTVTYP